MYCIDDEDGNDITGGDIAFVKHSTLRDYNEPLNTAKVGLPQSSGDYAFLLFCRSCNPPVRSAHFREE